MQGKKNDEGKLKWHLLPFEAVEKVVEVLTYGAEKYGEDANDPNWKKVSDPFNRYFSAAMRHMVDWKKGEQVDRETGMSHLAHAAANLLFLIGSEISQGPEEPQEHSSLSLDDILEFLDKVLEEPSVKMERFPPCGVHPYLKEQLYMGGVQTGVNSNSTLPGETYDYTFKKP